MNMSIIAIYNWIQQESRRYMTLKTLENTHERLNLTKRKMSHVKPAMKNPTYNHQFNTMLKLTQYWVAASDFYGEKWKLINNLSPHISLSNYMWAKFPNQSG